MRLAGVLLSVCRPAGLSGGQRQCILKDDGRAALAALLFNLTLMIEVEMLAATPDMPSVVTSAAFLFFLAQVEQTATALVAGRGVAAGLGLLAKYSVLFLGAGAFVWLLACPRRAPWLMTPWPWAAALLALVIFLPNLLWQSTASLGDFRLPVRPRRPADISPCRFFGEFSGGATWVWPRHSSLY